MPSKNNSSNIPLVATTVVVGTSSGFSTLPYASTGGSSPVGGTSNVASRDSNGNTAFNNVFADVTGNAASGTITLTVASSGVQSFSSGSGTATIVLPDATTLPVGWQVQLNNNATGNLTIQTNGGSTLLTMIPGAYVRLYCSSNSFSAGQWDYHWLMPSSAAYGTAGLTTTGYITATGAVTGNTLIPGYATTSTAAGTTTLTSSSAQQQYFTGSTTQTVVMPVTSTLVLGQTYRIVNNSSGVVTVQSSGANTIQAMASNTTLILTVILTSGTTAASWDAQYVIDSALTLPLSLANGGTNASLTASNGGIFYSTGTAGAILSGTSTANQLLISGSSTTPAWTTSTYPSTNAVNTLLYASSANTMAALSASANGVLISSNSNVPSWLANSGTPGYVLTANSGAPPSWQAGSSLSTTWTDEGTSFNAAAGNGYFITASCTATLPASPSQGQTIAITVDAATTTVTITANTGQIIRIGGAVSASAGTATNNARGDSVTLVYRSSDTAWISSSVIGTWSVT